MKRILAAQNRMARLSVSMPAALFLTCQRFANVYVFSDEALPTCPLARSPRTSQLALQQMKSLLYNTLTSFGSVNYPYYIPRNAVVVMMYKIDLRKYAGSSMPRSAPALPRAPGPPRHHDRATPAPHISPWCPREIIAADARLGERGAWRGALPGTDRSLPGNGADPRERRGSKQLWRPFPPGVSPTLTSRQHFHTTFNMQISTPISR